MGLKQFCKREWKIFKKFYNASDENRIGFYNFLAFFVVPIVGMSIFFAIVYFFWL